MAALERAFCVACTPMLGHGRVDARVRLLTRPFLGLSPFPSSRNLKHGTQQQQEAVLRHSQREPQSNACADGNVKKNAQIDKGLQDDDDDDRFMREALREAEKAASIGEVPVGAILVSQGKIIARAHNCVEKEGDPTAHAEMICIRRTARQLGGWRLLDSTLYVTLEPCPMCAGALLQARVGVLVWGARNPLLGADGSWVSLFPRPPSGHSTEELSCGDDVATHEKSLVHPFNPDIKVRSGVLASDCSEIMKSFFRKRRKQTTLAPANELDQSSYFSLKRKSVQIFAFFFRFFGSH